MAKTMPTAPVVTAGAVSPYLKQQASASRQMAEQKALSLQKEEAATGRTGMQTSAQRDVANIQAMAQKDVAQTRAGSAAMQAGAEQQMQVREIDDAEKTRQWKSDEAVKQRAYETDTLNMFLQLYNNREKRTETYRNEMMDYQKNQNRWDDVKSLQQLAAVHGQTLALAKKDTDIAKYSYINESGVRAANAKLDMIDGVEADVDRILERIIPVIGDLEPGTVLWEKDGDEIVSPLVSEYMTEAFNSIGITGITGSSFSPEGMREVGKRVAKKEITLDNLIKTRVGLKRMQKAAKLKEEAATTDYDKWFWGRLAIQADEGMASMDQLSLDTTPIEDPTRKERGIEVPLAPSMGKVAMVKDWAIYARKLANRRTPKEIWAGLYQANNFNAQQSYNQVQQMLLKLSTDPSLLEGAGGMGKLPPDMKALLLQRQTDQGDILQKMQGFLDQFAETQ